MTGVEKESNAALMAGLAVFDSCVGLVPAWFRPQCQTKRFPNTIEECGRDQKQQQIRAVERVFYEEMTAEKHFGQNNQGYKVIFFFKLQLLFFSLEDVKISTKTQTEELLLANKKVF